MRILLFEDRGDASVELKKWLDDHGYGDCKHVLSVRDARSVPLEDIDCIILDLNISPVGLTEDEIAQTHGGIITGWVWLESNVLKTELEEKMRGKVIILSEYIGFLKNISQDHSDLGEKLAGIETIPKSDSHVYDKLERKLREIQNSLRSGGGND